MRRIHVVTKSLWQIFLVIIEVGAVIFLLVFLSSDIRPIEDNFDLVERAILFLAVYEIFVYITLSFLNDARKDALLALKTSYEYAQFYCQTGNSEIRNYLTEKINLQLDNGMFNHLDIRREYEQLLLHIENQSLGEIQFKSIGIQHNYEMCDLQWRFTFLLRLFK